MEKRLEKSQAESIKIHVATTLRERKEIYRLRYRIYVDEMTMQLSTADHENRYVYDDLDKAGVLLYAKIGSEVIGTMRINFYSYTNFPSDLASIFSLDRFEKIAYDKISQSYAYGSKLMVSPHYRNSLALYLLMVKSYEIYCENQVQFNFGVCNSHLLQLYENFGYRRYGRSFTAPGYDGVLYPIVLLVDDLEHLRNVRSPYYRFGRKRKTVKEVVAKDFFDEFTEYNDSQNSQLLSEVELWNALCDSFKCIPTQVIPLLKGLSDSEASMFLHNCGVIVQYNPGDCIVVRGSKSYTANILLSGNLMTPCSSPVTRILPGQHFGAVGLNDQPLYPNDIVAATKTEVLVISRLSFQKFSRSKPDTAYKILRNLGSTL